MIPGTLKGLRRLYDTWYLVVSFIKVIHVFDHPIT